MNCGLNGGDNNTFWKVELKPVIDDPKRHTKRLFIGQPACALGLFAGLYRNLRSFTVRAASGIVVDTVLATDPGDAVRQTVASAARHGVTMMGALHAAVAK